VDIKKTLAVAAVPAVLVLGALGFTSQQGAAQQNGSAPQAQTAPATAPAQSAQQAENTKADPDNIQQGDQTSPDKPGQPEEQ